MLKRPGLRVPHHPLELGPFGEQRPGHAIVGVDVPLAERPTLGGDKGARPGYLSHRGVRYRGFVGVLLLLGYPCVDCGSHTFHTLSCAISHWESTTCGHSIPQCLTCDNRWHAVCLHFRCCQGVGRLLLDKAGHVGLVVNVVVGPYLLDGLDKLPERLVVLCRQVTT